MNKEQLTDDDLWGYLWYGDPNELSCTDKARLIKLVQKQPGKLIPATKRKYNVQLHLNKKEFEGENVKVLKRGNQE